MTEKTSVEEANAAYEARHAEDPKVTMGEIESEFGLKRNQLRNWRSNRQKKGMVLGEKATGGGVKAAGEDEVIRRFALEAIHPGENARKTFVVESLRDLAVSMRAVKGPEDPLVGWLRPDGVSVELLSGERRWRAAQLMDEATGESLSGLESLPVRLIERPPDPAERMKRGLIVNLQREDLPPLELAAEVCRMLELTDEASGQAVFSIRGLAEELGRDKMFVRHCQLAHERAPDRAKAALAEGRIDLRTAALIGSLPPSVAEQAAEEIAYPPFGSPMSHAAAARHVADHYRRDLRKASFDKKDAALVPEVGACTDCQWWGGNVDEVEGRARVHVCLNPSCFERKQGAAVGGGATDETGGADGGAGGDSRRVLKPSERDEVLDPATNMVRPESGFVDVAEAPDGYLLKADVKRSEVSPWGELVGESVARVVCFDFEGRERHLLPLKAAVEAAKVSPEGGRVLKGAAESGLKSDLEKGIELECRKAADRARHAGLLEACGDLQTELALCGWDREAVRCVLWLVIETALRKEDLVFLCQLLDPDSGKVAQPAERLAELVERDLREPRQLWALVVVALQVRQVRFNGFAGWLEDEGQNPMGVLCGEVGFAAEKWDGKVNERSAVAERSVLGEWRNRLVNAVTTAEGAVEAGRDGADEALLKATGELEVFEARWGEEEG